MVKKVIVEDWKVWKLLHLNWICSFVAVVARTENVLKSTMLRHSNPC